MEEILNKFDILNIRQENIDKMESLHESDINPNFITEFLMTINNYKQADILLKMFCGYSGKMYLVNYVEKEDGTPLIEILGARSSKGREKYQVSMQPFGFGCGILKCNCKDFTFRCQKEDIVCKHISFLVCKVAKIYDYKYFDSKVLAKHQVQLFKNALVSSAIWANRDLSIKHINSEFTGTKKLEEDDCCPICYMYFNDVSSCLSCPDCKGYVHKDCMDVWLETSKTCVYCRSFQWRDYVKNIESL
jgi:hypothetical protein